MMVNDDIYISFYAQGACRFSVFIITLPKEKKKRKEREAT